jgi:hypothetical protein
LTDQGRIPADFWRFRDWLIVKFDLSGDEVDDLTLPEVQLLGFMTYRLENARGEEADEVRAWILDTFQRARAGLPEGVDTPLTKAMRPFLVGMLCYWSNRPSQPSGPAPAVARSGGPPSGDTPPPRRGSARRKRDEGKGAECLGRYAACLERGELPPSPSELAAAVGCSTGTASRAIKEWEAKRKALAREDAADRYRHHG